MTYILNFLRAYPDDLTQVMSKARVAEAIAEIERLRAELDAERERAEKNAKAFSALAEAVENDTDSEYFESEHLDVVTATARLTAERDALSAELAAAREASQKARKVLTDRLSSVMRERDHYGREYGYSCMGVRYCDFEAEDIGAAIARIDAALNKGDRDE